jgi:formamidopyrimidine-DNA glycosylase
MPELPEVETIRRGLTGLINKKVKIVFRSDKNLRIKSTEELSKLVNAQITRIERRARYLIIDFSNSYSLIVHLGMSGRVTIAKEFQKLKHDHFACEFDDGLWLIFNDTRRFGFLDLIKSKDLKTHKMLTKLGPEPLCDEFNSKYLKEKLSKKKMNIKTTMMDNEIVVGVGNIYINESLFDAKISPLRNANELTDKEIRALITSIKKTIAAAIALGGSSINDYVDSKGDLGNFQNTFQVYGRADEKCLLCQSLIKKIKQNGRSSFYCSKCQK